MTTKQIPQTVEVHVGQPYLLRKGNFMARTTDYRVYDAQGRMIINVQSKSAANEVVRRHFAPAKVRIVFVPVAS